MNPRARALVIDLTASLLLGLAITVAAALAAPHARAGMIQGEDLERERVKAMLERPEVAAQMQKMGLSAQQAVARVDAMSDEEVRALAGKLDALPAGGQRLSNESVLLIIVIVLLIIIIL